MKNERTVDLIRVELASWRIPAEKQTAPHGHPPPPPPRLLVWLEPLLNILHT